MDHIILGNMFIWLFFPWLNKTRIPRNFQKENSMPMKRDQNRKKTNLAKKINTHTIPMNQYKPKKKLIEIKNILH